MAAQQDPVERYNMQFLGVGITQAILGVICLILGGVLFDPDVRGNLIYIGSGIWGGLMYATAGGIAIATGLKAERWNLIAGMTLSIFAAIIAFAVLIIEASYATLVSVLSCADQCDPDASHALHTTIALLSTAEVIVAIIHSAFCCSRTCGASETQPTVITTTIASPVPNSYAMPAPMIHTHPGIPENQPYLSPPPVYERPINY